MSPAPGSTEDHADSPAAVVIQANAAESLPGLDLAISDCRACERLVRWRERVALERRSAYADQDYWGRPVPGFGVERPKLLIVGLAPGAHGANRTGRVFTGDRSGDWLYAALHRAGLANQPTSTDANDGLELFETRVVVAVRCAPPDNKPTLAEFATCAPWLVREIELAAPDLRGVLALGAAAWTSSLNALGSLGWQIPRPKPRFGHGAQVVLSPGPGATFERPIALVGSYHPSQQNTFTGRLTAAMLDAAIQAARAATKDES